MLQGGSGKRGAKMNVNGITSAVNSYSTYTAEAKKAPATTEKVSEETKADVGVVYEPSTEETVAEEVTAKNKVADPELVAKLKADADARVAQFKQLVEQLIMKQSTAYGNATDIWQFLREGNFTVDPETKAQAQADIAEDGYWGVNQTSDRIIDFAKALAGDDKEKLGQMLESFKEGYKQAEKTWGGELPEISKKTYDAVLEKFDKLINGENQTADVTKAEA